eukprot:491027-Lingulodinium_polyedra.AAC.1
MARRVEGIGNVLEVGDVPHVQLLEPPAGVQQHHHGRLTPPATHAPMCPARRLTAALVQVQQCPIEQLAQGIQEMDEPLGGQGDHLADMPPEWGASPDNVGHQPPEEAPGGRVAQLGLLHTKPSAPLVDPPVGEEEHPHKLQGSGPGGHHPALLCLASSPPHAPQDLIGPLHRRHVQRGNRRLAIRVLEGRNLLVPARW